MGSCDKYSARRAVIVPKPQASAWGRNKGAVASERRFVGRLNRLAEKTLYLCKTM